MTKTEQDHTLRFLFEEADIRGETVHLDDAFRAITTTHNYSTSVRRLLGQFAAAVVLISSNLKYNGKIVLQARSGGPLSLIMLECTSASEIRGIARGDIDHECDQPLALIKDGQLAITIEREGGQRYQGIVSLEGNSLAQALDNYFLQSEQLNTRFWLASDGHSAAGMVLQQLPAQRPQGSESREIQWENAIVLAETLREDELLQLPAATLVYRLYHEEILRVFEPKPVLFKCSCSPERSLSALSCLPAEELDEIIREQGSVGMTCEMCGTAYSFDRNALGGVAVPPVLH